MMPEQWHAGRTVHRTIYRGDGPDDLIGIMDTPALAARVVDAVNGQGELIAICDRLLASLADYTRVAVTIPADGEFHHQLSMAVARAKGVV